MLEVYRECEPLYEERVPAEMRELLRNVGAGVFINKLGTDCLWKYRYEPLIRLETRYAVSQARAFKRQLGKAEYDTECSLDSMIEKEDQPSAVRHEMAGSFEETHDCCENKREEK